MRSYYSRQLSDKHCCPAKAACSVRHTFAILLNARAVNEPGPLKSYVKHQSRLACRPAINPAAPRPAATQTICKAYLEQFPSGSLLQLEAVVAALLALLLLVFQQRPRGWCNHTFVKVRDATCWCMRLLLAAGSTAARLSWPNSSQGISMAELPARWHNLRQLDRESLPLETYPRAQSLVPTLVYHAPLSACYRKQRLPQIASATCFKPHPMFGLIPLIAGVS